jgi:hypothetical protein
MSSLALNWCSHDILILICGKLHQYGAIEGLMRRMGPMKYRAASAYQFESAQTQGKIDALTDLAPSGRSGTKTAFLNAEPLLTTIPLE